MKHCDMVKLMGKQVTVLKVFERMEGERKFDRVTYFWEGVALNEQRVGWVTGVSHVQEGQHILPSYEEPGFFKQTKRRPCLLVRFWPTLKEVKVPVYGFIDHPIGEPKNNTYKWTLRDKELMRETVSGMQRDNEGRFVKITTEV